MFLNEQREVAAASRGSRSELLLSCRLPEVKRSCNQHPGCVIRAGCKQECVLTHSCSGCALRPANGWKLPAGTSHTLLMFSWKSKTSGKAKFSSQLDSSALVQHRLSVEPIRRHHAGLMVFLVRSSTSVYGPGPSAGLNFETWLLAANSSFLDGAIVSCSCCCAGNHLFCLCCCSGSSLLPAAISVLLVSTFSTVMRVPARS